MKTKKRGGGVRYNDAENRWVINVKEHSHPNVLAYSNAEALFFNDIDCKDYYLDCYSDNVLEYIRDILTFDGIPILTDGKITPGITKEQFKQVYTNLIVWLAKTLKQSITYRENEQRRIVEIEKSKGSYDETEQTMMTHDFEIRVRKKLMKNIDHFLKPYEKVLETPIKVASKPISFKDLYDDSNDYDVLSYVEEQKDKLSTDEKTKIKERKKEKTRKVKVPDVSEKVPDIPDKVLHSESAEMLPKVPKKNDREYIELKIKLQKEVNQLDVFNLENFVIKMNDIYERSMYLSESDKYMFLFIKLLYSLQLFLVTERLLFILTEKGKPETRLYEIKNKLTEQELKYLFHVNNDHGILDLNDLFIIATDDLVEELIPMKITQFDVIFYYFYQYLNLLSSNPEMKLPFMVDHVRKFHEYKYFYEERLKKFYKRIKYIIQNKDVVYLFETKYGLFLNKACDNCGRILPLKSCICHKVSYCSTICQKEHWPEHKKVHSKS